MKNKIKWLYLSKLEKISKVFTDTILFSRQLKTKLSNGLIFSFPKIVHNLVKSLFLFIVARYENSGKLYMLAV